MNYRISYNEDLSRFHVHQISDDGSSRLTACDIPLDGPSDDWNHQQAARQYLEHLPSDVRFIHIDAEGKYSLEQLAAVARGNDSVESVVSLIKEFDHDFVGKDWSDALLHGRAMCVIPSDTREGVVIQNLFAGLGGDWRVIEKRHGQGWGHDGMWLSKPSDLVGSLGEWLSGRQSLSHIKVSRFGPRPSDEYSFDEWRVFLEENGCDADEWRDTVDEKGFSLKALKAAFPDVEDSDVFDLLYYGFGADDGWYDNERRSLVAADGSLGFTYDADDYFAGFVLNLDAIRENETAEEDNG